MGQTSPSQASGKGHVTRMMPDLQPLLCSESSSYSQQQRPGAHTHTQNGATSSFRSVGLTTHLYSPGEKGSNIRERLALPPEAMLTDSWSVWNGNFRAASTSSRTYNHNISSRRHMRATWQGVEGAKGAKEVQREFVEVFFLCFGATRCDGLWFVQPCLKRFD